MCDCEEFCPKCSVEYRLTKRCPATLDMCEVTSNDIEVVRQEINISVLPVRYKDDKGNDEDPILIMKLSKN